MMIRQSQYNRGYTLLFAVLVSSVVLGIGISILNIAKKEFLIATSARDSSAAFYAADAGVECAIYADDPTGADAFNTREDNTGAFNCNLPYSFTEVDPGNPTDDEGNFIFHIKSGSADTTQTTALALAGKSCAVVTVSKVLVDGQVRTIIDSRGYNIGWNPGENPNVGTCDLPSPKRVERGIKYSY